MDSIVLAKVAGLTSSGIFAGNIYLNPPQTPYPGLPDLPKSSRCAHKKADYLGMSQDTHGPSPMPLCRPSSSRRKPWWAISGARSILMGFM